MKSIEFYVTLGNDSAQGTPLRGSDQPGDCTEPNVPISLDDLVKYFPDLRHHGKAQGRYKEPTGTTWINMMSCAIELGLTRHDRALLLFPFFTSPSNT